MLRLRIIGLMFLSASLAALLLGLGAWLLSGATPVRAQTQGGQPTRPSIIAADVDATNFPTVTLSFPCVSPGEGYQVLENGVVITNVTLATRSEPVDTRVAILLDLFRERTGGGKSELPLEMASVLLSVGEVLTRLEKINVFTVTTHQMGVFAPAADAASVASIISPTTWTYDLNKLFTALFTDYVPDAEPNFRAEVGKTMTATRLLDIVNSLLLSELAVDAPEHQALIIYSDGSDGGSTTPLATVVNLAKARGIPVYTVFIPTYDRSTNLEELVDDTGGRYEPSYTNTTGIAEWLSTIYAPKIVCDITYRVQQNPPARVEVQSIGGAQPGTVATALLPATLRREAPQVTIDSPRFGQTYTLTNTETVALAVTWEPEAGDDARAVDVEFTVLGPDAAGNKQIITTHVAILTATVPMPYRIELNATTLLAGQHLFRAVVTDDFGLVGTAEQPFAVQPLPTPAPVITPLQTLITDGVRERLTAAGGWLWGNDGTHLMLFILVALSVMILALLGLLLFRVWWTTPPPVSEVGAPAAAEYAILDRVQMSERVPYTKQMIRLELNSSEQLELPGIFLEDDSTLYRGDELASFLLAYRATLHLGGATVKITRPSSTDANSASFETLHYEKIGIQLADAWATFPLGAREERELQDEDIVQFGDLHYKFIRMQKSDA